MATKDQERKALEQIRQIVAGLGEESYIGKAFEGAFDDAEFNIDNDFWNSWKDRYEYSGKTLDRANEQITEKMREIKELKKEVVELQRRNETHTAAYAKLSEEYSTLYGRRQEIENKAIEKDNKIRALELENMKLKAKLYDMMVGA